MLKELNRDSPQNGRIGLCEVHHGLVAIIVGEYTSVAWQLLFKLTN